ncbi:MAG: ABC transporter substrate-binding protein [Anaerolineae bacterium]|nr:ABC transporter substrate-binding protein [Anaerolineae bacterium]
MSKLKSVLLLAVVVLVAVTATACGSQTDAASNKPTGPLTIGINEWPGFGILKIAEVKGFFQQEGVDVELVPFDAPNQTTQAFAEKRLDGFVSTISDAVAQAAAGIPVQVIWLVDQSLGGDVLVAKGVENVADLRGKRIGVAFGTFGHVFTSVLLQEAGLDASEVSIVSLDPVEIPGALEAGIIDAGYTYDPFLQQAVQNGAVILGSSADMPGIVIDVISFQKGSIDADPDRVGRFIRAISAAQAWWAENPDEGNAIVGEWMRLTAADIAASMPLMRLYSAADNLAAMDPASQDSSSAYRGAQFALDTFMQAGLIEEPVDLQTIINPSFVQSLLSR